MEIVVRVPVLFMRSTSCPNALRKVRVAPAEQRTVSASIAGLGYTDQIFSEGSVTANGTKLSP